MQIYVLNGPNLNLLGQREVEIYGHLSLKDIENSCAAFAKEHQLKLLFAQSNSEAKLIELIHQAIDSAQAIVINGAAYSHSSIAILDALRAFKGLVIEVHLSNIYKREQFRRFSYIASRADAVISGCGALGYHYALCYIVEQLCAR